MPRRRQPPGPYPCPGGCGALLLHRLVGDTCALDVTADLRPLTPVEQAEVRGPNRLVWCLRQSRWSGPQLRWVHRWHPVDCPWPHVADHRCPGRGGTQDRLF